MDNYKINGQALTNMPTVLKSKPPAAERTERLGPEAWIEAGRVALTAGGIARVKVEPLAVALGVTTGSFYWHFKDRSALLSGLLQDWETTNSAELFAAVAAHPSNPDAQFSALADVWIEERDYNSAWDSAVRDWARIDPKAEAVVRRVDERRVDLLHGVFQRLGYEEPEAFVRARITYFHQVGYYALHIVEPRKRRVTLTPVCLRILKGQGPGK